MGMEHKSFFTEEQIIALKAKLDPEAVKTRSQAGRKLSYLEGWQVIREANRIFGFGHWDRTVQELRMVNETERNIGRDRKKGWGVSYICRVEIKVYSMKPDYVGVLPVIRHGTGSGHGIDMDLGLAHESAVKEAETDAMKRALMTFGNPFGLALYDKEQSEVGYDDEPTDHDDHPERAGELMSLLATVAETSLRNSPSMEELQARWSRLPLDLKLKLADVKEEMKAKLAFTEEQ
jgi:DNA recombination protein Rad52